MNFIDNLRKKRLELKEKNLEELIISVREKNIEGDELFNFSQKLQENFPEFLQNYSFMQNKLLWEGKWEYVQFASNWKDLDNCIKSTFSRFKFWDGNYKMTSPEPKIGSSDYEYLPEKFKTNVDFIQNNLWYEPLIKNASLETCLEFVERGDLDYVSLFRDEIKYNNQFINAVADKLGELQLNNERFNDKAFLINNPKEMYSDMKDINFEKIKKEKNIEITNN